MIFAGFYRVWVPHPRAFFALGWGLQMSNSGSAFEATHAVGRSSHYNEGEHIMAIDPVCKMKVDEQSAAGQTNYNGKEYFFCSKDCEQKFEEEPTQFAEAAA